MPESDLFRQIKSLETEQINPRTKEIDALGTKEILELINDEDRKVPAAVRETLDDVAKAVDIITASFKAGGRLFYVGAGTSGRLGIIDAAECPPTFGVDYETTQGIIAGGKEAVFKAVEFAEDFPEKGAEEIASRKISPPDVVCGIAASGRTPFVIGALAEAKKRGCKTIFVTTVAKKKAENFGVEADVIIQPEVGPEVIAGSTRMKAGTAQKLILNMLTTASMIKLGKTYGNIMIDLKLWNNKLKERAKRILMDFCGTDYKQAEELLEEAKGDVKLAFVMAYAGVGAEEAAASLKEADGFAREAIKKILKHK